MWNLEKLRRLHLFLTKSKQNPTTNPNIYCLYKSESICELYYGETNWYSYQNNPHQVDAVFRRNDDNGDGKLSKQVQFKKQLFHVTFCRSSRTWWSVTPGTGRSPASSLQSLWRRLLLPPPLHHLGKDASHPPLPPHLRSSCSCYLSCSFLSFCFKASPTMARSSSTRKTSRSLSARRKSDTWN